MDLEEDANEQNVIGDYQNFLEEPQYLDEINQKKNDTLKDNASNNDIFEKINEIGNFHHQTELNKEDLKTKEHKKIKHKNSISGNSTNDLFKALKKKTNREGEKRAKKKKKTKTDNMDFSLKNKTELNNYEDIKKENEKKIYDAFNNEEYFDVYGDQQQDPSGDLFNLMNEEHTINEVNQSRPVYNTQMDREIPESFNMIISSEINY